MNSIKKWVTKKNNIEISRVSDGRCNCYLVTKGKLNALIDTSINREEKKLLENLNKMNIEALHCILLTHSHFDHAGNARILQERFGSLVFIHSSEMQYLKEGYTYLPKGTILFTKILTSIIGGRITRLQRYRGCDCEKLFTEERLDGLPDIFKIQILHIPGHTSGSVSFIIDNEIAVVGDSLINRKSHIFPPFADFPELLPDTWNKLLDTNCRLFLPSHGKEIERDLLEYWREKLFPPISASFDNLKARPVSHVSLASVSEKVSKARMLQAQQIKKATIRQHALKKFVLSILVHMAGILAFYCAYTVPAFQEFLQQVVLVNRIPIAGFFAILLIVVPALLITYIWSNKFLFHASQMPLKQRLCLCVILIFNVIVSVCYLVMLDIFLKGMRII